MTKMPRFECVHRNLLFRSNNSGDSSFDSWGGVFMHAAVDAFVNRCALVTSVGVMILCIASALAFPPMAHSLARGVVKGIRDLLSVNCTIPFNYDHNLYLSLYDWCYSLPFTKSF